MAFFEELGRKAKDVAAVAADKAKDMAAVAADKARETTEKTKISVAIAGEQREIEKNCRLIGEWFINEYEGELPEGVQELADAVAASKARIAELEAQAQTAEAAKSQDTADKLAAEIERVRAEASEEKVAYELRFAGAKNVTAAKTLLRRARR